MGEASNQKVKNRWLIVVGALLIQLSLGAIYAWGAFTTALEAQPADVAMTLSPDLLGVTDQAAYDEVKTRYDTLKDQVDQAQKGTDQEAIEAARTALAQFKDEVVTEEWIDQTFEQEKFEQQVFNFTATQTSWIFSAGLAVFALVMIMAGRWQDKAGPRVVALTGGAVLGAGYILASFTGTSFIAMLLLVGVVGGAGIGLGYVCPIAAAVKWFPDLKGLITGLAVAGFGAGAFIFVKLAGAWGDLIAQHGVNFTFLVFGIIFAASVILGALLLSNPPAGYKPAGWNPDAAKARTAPVARDMTQSEIVKTGYFWMIWLAFVFSAGCGLMVIKCLKGYGVKELSLSAAAAGSALGLLSLFNGLGRIAWGTMSQKLTARGALIVMVFLQAAMLFALPVMSGAVLLAVAGCWVGFNFGGNFALFPLLTAESFGTKNLGANYGAVFTAYGVGGIAGPLLAGQVWDTFQSYTWAFIPAGIACVLAGIIGIMLSSPGEQKHQKAAAAVDTAGASADPQAAQEEEQSANASDSAKQDQADE